ncbi:MAG: PilZ domain-containing protein [Nitrospira sp.]|nr:PilZ domain-containing protein [Nitrospira sp.]MBK9949572.1 PilZ domain-containing protein [Nitrospira sp.]
MIRDHSRPPLLWARIIFKPPRILAPQNSTVVAVVVTVILRQESDERMAHTGKFVIRTYHRIPIRCEAYYMGGDFLGKGTIMNLCRNGFRILGDHQVVPGMELVVRLSLPDKDAPVEIQRVAVRWVRGLLFGARIMTMSPDGEDRVATFLSARLRAYCASS